MKQKQKKDRDGGWIQVAGLKSLSTRTGDGDGVKVESGLLAWSLSQGRIDGWNGMKNRHKFGDENLIRFKALSMLASQAN